MRVGLISDPYSVYNSTLYQSEAKSKIDEKIKEEEYCARTVHRR